MKRNHEASLPLVVLRALPRELPTAAVASAPQRLAKAFSEPHRARPSGLSVLRRPAHWLGLPRAGNQVSSPLAPPPPSDQAKRPALCPSMCEHGMPYAIAKSQNAGSRSREPVVRLALSALVCFVIEIQGKVAAHRAWPNPSFKRTRLRRSA